MPESKISKTILLWVRKILIYLLSAIIIIAALIFAADKSPQKSLFGFRYYTVLTPSMEPTYSVGDIVVVKLANATDIFEGDVITFNPSSNSEAYLTHRVTQKIENYENTGVTCFKTKGDANEDEDGFLIDSSRVIGKVTVSIPKIGYVIRFVQLKWYFVLPLAILFLILLHLLKMYLSTGVDENAEQAQIDSNTKKEK